MNPWKNAWQLWISRPHTHTYLGLSSDLLNSQGAQHFVHNSSQNGLRGKHKRHCHSKVSVQRDWNENTKQTTEMLSKIRPVGGEAKVQIQL